MKPDKQPADRFKTKGRSFNLTLQSRINLPLKRNLTGLCPHGPASRQF